MKNTTAKFCFNTMVNNESHVIESKAMDSRGASDDAQEGVNSFLEKRSAKFTNKITSDMPDFFPWWKD